MAELRSLLESEFEETHPELKELEKQIDAQIDFVRKELMKLMQSKTDSIDE